VKESFTVNNVMRRLLIMPKYLINVGMNYVVNGAEKRVEPGDIVSDIPAKSIKWLLSDGYISIVEEEVKE
jgi:hypothetical protein